jgi:HSP20 family protein
MTEKHDVAVTRYRTNGSNSAEANLSRPDTDIYETPDSYVIKVDMPGTPKDGVHVTLDRNSLVLKGIMEGRDGEDVALLYKELNRSGYYRVLNLGEGVDRNNIDARYEEGVLTVRLLKKEKVQPKQIVIH